MRGHVSVFGQEATPRAIFVGLWRLGGTSVHHDQAASSNVVERQTTARTKVKGYLNN